MVVFCVRAVVYMFLKKCRCLIAISNISRSNEWATNKKHLKNSVLNCSIGFWLSLHIASSNWMMKNSPAKKNLSLAIVCECYETGKYVVRTIVTRDKYIFPSNIGVSCGYTT